MSWRVHELLASTTQHPSLEPVRRHGRLPPSTRLSRTILFTAIVAEVRATSTGHVETPCRPFHHGLAVRTLRPLLPVAQVQQRLTSRVLLAHSLVHALFAEPTRLGVATGTTSHVSTVAGGWDEGRTSSVVAVRRVRSGKFLRQRRVGGGDLRRDKSGHGRDVDRFLAALERLLVLDGPLHRSQEAASAIVMFARKPAHLILFCRFGAHAAVGHSGELGFPLFLLSLLFSLSTLLFLSA